MRVVLVCVLVALLFGSVAKAETTLSGSFTQGGLIIGQTEPGARVSLDGRNVRVSDTGVFVFGFTRDFGLEASLGITTPDGEYEERTLSITPRNYAIQRIDGLPPKMVTPPEMVLTRIRSEISEIKAARAIDTNQPLFLSGWEWPTIGRISGVYGSQRVLNGEPAPALRDRHRRTQGNRCVCTSRRDRAAGGHRPLLYRRHDHPRPWPWALKRLSAYGERGRGGRRRCEAWRASWNGRFNRAFDRASSGLADQLV